MGNSNLELGVQMGQQGKLSATTNCHNQAEAGWRMVAWRGQTSAINCFETDWAVLKRCNNAVAGTGSGVVMCQVLCRSMIIVIENVVFVRLMC